MIRILIVDDSALMRRLLGRLFVDAGDFIVEFARNGQEALEKAEIFQPDVITLDIHMPEMDGLDCLDRIMLQRPCPVVMISALTEEGAEQTLAALQMGAVDFVAKPTRAVSLEIDELGPLIVQKVRVAASIPIRRSRRLKERISRVLPPTPVLSHPHGETFRSNTRTGLILIGSSTGGPPALEAILSSLPADFPLPVVIAQHMPATFTGPLSRRLDKLCALCVVEVDQQRIVEPGHVYIARGDADIILSSRGGTAVCSTGPFRCAVDLASQRRPPGPIGNERCVASSVNRDPADRNGQRRCNGNERPEKSRRTDDRRGRRDSGCVGNAR